jgi:hypothetical protein
MVDFTTLPRGVIVLNQVSLPGRETKVDVGQEAQEDPHHYHQLTEVNKIFGQFAVF